MHRTQRAPCQVPGHYRLRAAFWPSACFAIAANIKVSQVGMQDFRENTTGHSKKVTDFVVGDILYFSFVFSTTWLKWEISSKMCWNPFIHMQYVKTKKVMWSCSVYWIQVKCLPEPRMLRHPFLFQIINTELESEVTSFFTVVIEVSGEEKYIVKVTTESHEQILWYTRTIVLFCGRKWKAKLLQNRIRKNDANMTDSNAIIFL